MGMLRSMMRGDPSPLMRHAADSGATCTMPDGTVMTFQQFQQFMGDKTPAEAFAACGYDLSQVMGLIDS